MLLGTWGMKEFEADSVGAKEHLITSHPQTIG